MTALFWIFPVDRISSTYIYPIAGSFSAYGFNIAAAEYDESINLQVVTTLSIFCS